MDIPSNIKYVLCIKGQKQVIIVFLCALSSLIATRYIVIEACTLKTFNVKGYRSKLYLLRILFRKRNNVLFQIPFQRMTIGRTSFK